MGPQENDRLASNMEPQPATTEFQGGDEGEGEGEAVEAYWEEQQRQYAGSEYNINWEEVKEGKSAGMPGRWVSGCG